jgi:hypothetical protein
MSRVIGYRLPWPSAGAILFVAPVVAVRVDVAAAEDLRPGFADDVDGVVGDRLRAGRLEDHDLHGSIALTRMVSEILCR